MNPRRPANPVLALELLDRDCTQFRERYAASMREIQIRFFGGFAEDLSPDVLRIIAGRFLEIAEQREPAPISGQATSRAYGWRKLTAVTRDPDTLEISALIGHLSSIGHSAPDICGVLAAQRIPTQAGRLDWRPDVVKSIAERESSRGAVWEGLNTLDAR